MRSEKAIKDEIGRCITALEDERQTITSDAYTNGAVDALVWMLNLPGGPTAPSRDVKLHAMVKRKGAA